jgi:hypothetical protein
MARRLCAKAKAKAKARANHCRLRAVDGLPVRHIRRGGAAAEREVARPPWISSGWNFCGPTE